VLVTNDKRLKNIVIKLGGNAIFLDDFIERLDEK
jgi:hypothetical protein